MKQAFQTTIRDLNRAQLLAAGISVSMATGVLVAVGELNDHLSLILAGALVVLGLMVLVRKGSNAWLLQDLASRANPENETDEFTEQNDADAWEALVSFGRNESILVVVLWLTFALVSWGLASFVLGVSDWQLVVLESCLICAGLVNLLLVGYVESEGLAAVRKAMPAMVPADDSEENKKSGSLRQRFMLVFSVSLLVVAWLGTLAWLSQTRVQMAEALMAERKPAFVQMADALERVLQKNPNLAMKDAMRHLDASGSIHNQLSVMDGLGQVLLKAPAADFDSEWLKRIGQSRGAQWRDLRTPFMYLTRPFQKSDLLVMTLPMSLIYDSFSDLAWSGVAAMLWLLLISLLVFWLITRAQMQPLALLAGRFQQFAAGKSEVSIEAVGSGEIADLARDLQGFVQSQLDKTAIAEERAHRLLETQKVIESALQTVREAADRRTSVADQTATSVVEMRSAIQSISEQIDALREASSDCSSAMFEIDQSVREVSSSSENLQTLVEDTASSMNEIAVSMDQVVANVDDLANTADETVASLAVMDGSIKQVEESTTHTHRLSEEVSELASRGANSVSQTIDGIRDIQQITDEAQEVINRLGTQMEAVGKILTVIGDVAEQTNLLALNAAIIAAAAGEHGKGFAVVADEIKDLADRTSTSTKEIAGLIRSVQSESRLAIDAMQRGSGSVRRGVELANTAGEALQQILESVQQVNQMANDIATSTAEHTNISRSITHSMTSMSSMVREIKRTVAEQSKGGKRVSRASEKMRDDARFVFRSANEQVQAAAGVSRTMERISEMVLIVGKAMVEQTNGVNHVAKVAEEVRDTMEEDRDKMTDLEGLADKMGLQVNEFLGQKRAAGEWKK